MKALPSVVMCAAVVALSLPSGHAASLDSANPTARTTPDACTPLRQTAVTYMNPDGTPATAPTSTTATLYHFQQRPGDDIAEIIPPSTFQPSTASDAQLRSFGFAAPAAGTTARQAWNERMRNWKGVKPEPLCTRDRSATTYPSANWSGVMANNENDYREVESTHSVPPFLTTPQCGNDDLALWSGLGGDGRNTKLLQAGEDSHDSSLGYQGMNAWWEAISPSPKYDTGQVVVDNTFANPNDIVDESTYYYIVQNAVYFTWYNETQGSAAPTQIIRRLGNLPMSDFYDGTTAEFINERSTDGSGHLYQLRNYGYMPWSAAYVSRAGQPIKAVGAYPHVFLNMVGAGSQVISGLAGGTMTSGSSWNMHWKGCS